MRTKERPLSTSDLRIGMSVQADVFGEIVNGEIAGVADFEVLVKWGSHVGKYIPCGKVKPILRRLSTMTEQEAREVYRISNGQKFKVIGWDGKKQSCLHEITYSDYLDGISQSHLERAIYDIEVVDYLDRLGFDTRKWIDKGLALDDALIDWSN